MVFLRRHSCSGSIPWVPSHCARGNARTIAVNHSPEFCCFFSTLWFHQTSGASPITILPPPFSLLDAANDLALLRQTDIFSTITVCVFPHGFNLSSEKLLPASFGGWITCCQLKDNHPCSNYLNGGSHLFAKLKPNGFFSAIVSPQRQMLDDKSFLSSFCPLVWPTVTSSWGSQQ